MKRAIPFVILLVVCSVSQAWAAVFYEDFGDKPIRLIEQNHRHWPNIMPLLESRSWVYHRYVNGYEDFYYRGDAKALNDALKKFAAVKAKTHEVLLRPGPGIARSSQDAKTISYDWNVYINGGVTRHLIKLDQGDKVWSKSPTITVCVGDGIDLTKIEIPNGVSVVDVADLSRRYRQALTSKDTAVRGAGVDELAILDPYNTESLAAIAKLLMDEDDWVRLIAAGAVANFGKKAESVLPVLREMLSTQDKDLKATIEQAIQTIQQAKDTTAAEREHRLIQEKIRKFCDSRKR